MRESLQLDYYYGIEAEQFSFYRIPRLLMKEKRFKGLSSDAKLLYGLMLDRMTLSMKNGWLDEENRAYIIYTVENIMEDLGCAKATCVKVMKELDCENGIGLIEKKRRGLGKPDIIYVKNFATIEKESSNQLSVNRNEKPLDERSGDRNENALGETVGNREENSSFNETVADREEKFLNKIAANREKTTEVQNLNLKKFKNDTSERFEMGFQEVQNLDFQKFKNDISRSSISELQEVQEIDSNYNKRNHNDKSNKNWNGIHSIHPSPFVSREETTPFVSTQKMDEIDSNDRIEEVNAYMALIRENLEYETYQKENQYEEKELYEEIYQTICDVVCVRRKTIRINGEEHPYELVKSRFLKLNRFHVEYVMHCMKETVTKVVNIRAYLLTALYNAPSTMTHYYQQEVQYDMYGGGWKEKGIG